MTTESLHQKIATLDGCRIVYENHNGVILEGKGGRSQANQNPLYVMRREAVEDASWDDLRGVLLGERPPQVITWMSRVVGYYSSIKRAGHSGWNWNRSKISELDDRRKGNYAFPSDETVKHPLPAQPRQEQHCAAD